MIFLGIDTTKKIPKHKWKALNEYNREMGLAVEDIGLNKENELKPENNHILN